MYNTNSNELIVESEKARSCNDNLSFQFSIFDETNQIHFVVGKDEYLVKKIIITTENEENTIISFIKNKPVVEKGDKRISGEKITGDLRKFEYAVAAGSTMPCIELHD